MSRRIIIASAVIVVLLAALGVAFWPQPSIAPKNGGESISNNEHDQATTSPTPFSTGTTEARTQSINSTFIPNAASAFSFTAEIPAHWKAEAIPASEAIAIYDPQAPGATNLEKSQLFIRHFSGNDFLTLSTVTIHSQESRTINSHPAIRYDIEKKPNVSTFTNQPSWRSERHVVTDIRASSTSPSEFYVIAKAPTLRDAAYEDFLQSFTVIEK